MSSQHGAEVPFSIATSQDSFRLIELSARDLQSMLSTTPSQDNIKLKSSDVDKGHIALCIGGATYEIRQVQTSNSVHVVMPHQHGSTQIDSPGLPGYASIATCGSVLEPIGPIKASAEPHLRESLPTFDGNMDSRWPEGRTAQSMQEIFDDIPISDPQCLETWETLFVFRLGSKNQYWVPSPRALIKAWSAIVTVVLTESINLDAPLDLDFIESKIQDSQELPIDLIRTMLSNLSTSGGDDSHVLDRSRTVLLVGQSLLQDLVEVSRSDLIRQWQNILPENWRNDADLPLLTGVFESGSGDQIRYISPESTNPKEADPATSTSTSKRKWHEKFKQTRNA